MAKVNESLTRAQLVAELKTLRSNYISESDLLNTGLDNEHHAFLMKEYGENKQLKEAVAALNALILKYDTVGIKITFDLNGCEGTPLEMTDQISGSIATLPLKGDITPPEGMIIYGWNTRADGKGKGYTFGANFKVPDINTTLYAYLGPAPEEEE